jgi:hypothetical protein
VAGIDGAQLRRKGLVDVDRRFGRAVLASPEHRGALNPKVLSLHRQPPSGDAAAASRKSN